MTDQDDPNDYAIKDLVIKYIRPELLDLPTLIPLLNKYHLLAGDDCYDLMNPLHGPLKRADALMYEVLPKNGPRAFRLFVKCLQEEKQHLGHQKLAKLFTSSPICKSFVVIYCLFLFVPTVL